MKYLKTDLNELSGGLKLQLKEIGDSTLKEYPNHTDLYSIIQNRQFEINSFNSSVELAIDKYGDEPAMYQDLYNEHKKLFDEISARIREIRLFKPTR